MNSTSSLINASLDDTLMSSMDDDDGGSQPLCYYALYYILLVTLAIAMLMMTVTLILIPCHPRLRKQHHIFPYNLVLSDLSGAIALASYEGFKHELSLEAYMLLYILFTTSIMVSLLSIVLVTGYQFITIRVDPFGTRNIITTPRLIATCIVTWVISFACSFSISHIDIRKLLLVLLSFSWSTTLATGLCYIFIYRSIAKVPCGGNITQERKEENQRVLRTFGLIFGTTVLCWMCPWITWTLQSRPEGFLNVCVINASYTMININCIANSVIYWWRLQEFRAMFCNRKNGAINPQLPMVIDL